MKAGSLREAIRAGIHGQLAQIRESLIQAGYTVRQDGHKFSILRGTRVVAGDMIFGELVGCWRARGREGMSCDRPLAGQEHIEMTQRLGPDEPRGGNQ